MGLFRGWFGEKKTVFRLWLTLNNKDYKRYHNVIIPANNGTTQIDHLIVSQYGLFIVETKNLKGWIFGSEKQVNWTQTLFNKKYSFQNPLRQTYRQKMVLSEFLFINELFVHPVVYFVGDSSFRTEVPANVMSSGLGRYIKRFRDQVFTVEEANRILEVLDKHLSESKISNKQHVRSLRKRHKSITFCPRCGSNLIERTAKRGRNAGKKFLGCTSYPSCRFAKDL